MKAAVWTKPNHMEIQDIPDPKPKSGEVLIKVLGCGVCGTDCHIFAGEVPLAKPPQVLGHEIVGEVIENAPDIPPLKTGLKVCVDPVIGCGVCPFCQSGKTNLCPSPTIIGYARIGGFAPYTTVPRSHLYPVSQDMDNRAGILVETLACVINGYDRLEIKSGRSTLILGAGCVGLLWTELIKRSVTTRLVQTDIVPERLEAAKKLGADFVICSQNPDWVKEAKEREPAGFDCVIDATGSAKAMQEALPLVKKGGKFMIFGVAPEEEKLVISPYEMFAKELTIIGSKMPPNTMDRAVKIIEAGLVDYKTLVTTTMPLDKLPEAIQAFNKKKARHIKIMIDPDMTM